MIVDATQHNATQRNATHPKLHLLPLILFAAIFLSAFTISSSQPPPWDNWVVKDPGKFTNGLPDEYWAPGTLGYVSQGHISLTDGSTSDGFCKYLANAPQDNSKIVITYYDAQVNKLAQELTSFTNQYSQADGKIHYRANIPHISGSEATQFDVKIYSECLPYNKNITSNRVHNCCEDNQGRLPSLPPKCLGDGPRRIVWTYPKQYIGLLNQDHALAPEHNQVTCECCDVVLSVP